MSSSQPGARLPDTNKKEQPKYVRSNRTLSIHPFFRPNSLPLEGIKENQKAKKGIYVIERKKVNKRGLYRPVERRNDAKRR